MKKNMLALMAFISFTFLSATAQVNTADAIVGFWKTGDGKAIVEVFKQADKYSGKIIWLAEPNDPETKKPKVDKKNEDEKLRTRPIIGMVNLRDFKFIKTKLWEDGKIYDPKSGEDYSCTIKMTDDNTIEVRGYVGISLFGRTDTWKRQKVK
jgi:uncharacterized protein (DUF2147 family)